ncbi:MAG: peptide chain release factor 2 [Alphaproteobacteria bacterium]|nr:peptide chain release factor 2 [Alphaproteobacteria bacterium]
MKAEIVALNTKFKKAILLLRSVFDWDNALLRREELDALTAEPDLWNNPERAQKLVSERNALVSQLDTVLALDSQVLDGFEMIELADAEGDDALLHEAETAFMALEEVIAQAELDSLLNGEADKNDTFLEIHAGAGGTEAQDWADMLLRMFTRWAEKKGYKVSLNEESIGDEAGIKSATIKVSGYNAYGWLKNESGVHRLVRISPFDSNARRHTSFASVWVYPVVDDTIQIDINPADCRIDLYRASGAGGQHVNRTESAVRITHIPTGIVVQSQTGRSQFQNKDEAWAMLRSRLYELELKKRQEAQGVIEASKGDNGWGNQIRSYVLQPYQMVKDLRTGYETSDTSGVLDGDLDGFMRAALAGLSKGE